MQKKILRGGRELFKYILLFLDVEHSCLPGSLDDLVRIKIKSRFRIQ